jgi:hypothetical protein
MKAIFAAIFFTLAALQTTTAKPKSTILESITDFSVESLCNDEMIEATCDWVFEEDKRRNLRSWRGQNHVRVAWEECHIKGGSSKDTFTLQQHTTENCQVEYTDNSDVTTDMHTVVTSMTLVDNSGEKVLTFKAKTEFTVSDNDEVKNLKLEFSDMQHLCDL